MKPARLILALLWAALLAQAAPPSPGYYTFDGSSLRPLAVQRRAGSESAFSSWKQLLQPFGRTPSFLAALTERAATNAEEDDEDEEEVEDEEDVEVEERDDDEDEEDDGTSHRGLPTVSSAHLLPDYLTHQEFLKPQLQAAGFSGGRIIAGPFPVPLSGLPPPPHVPKPPPRSGSVAPPPLPPPPPPPASKPKLQIFKQQLQQYKPVQFPAVAVTPGTLAPPPPPPPPPATTTAVPTSSKVAVTPRPAPAKLNYVIPLGGPVHWHAAHQSGPEKPASVLGQPTYSHPAVFNQESSSGPTKLSYGGWTPIYSASYSHVAVQDEEEPNNNYQYASAPSISSVETEEQHHVQEVQQELKELVAEADETAPVVVVVAASSSTPDAAQPDRDDESAGTSTFIPPPSSVSNTPAAAAASATGTPDGVALTLTPNKKAKTVRKRKAKQVANPSSLSPWPADAEVVIVTAGASSPPALPAAVAGSGRGQGRYVGHVMPASLYDRTGRFQN